MATTASTAQQLITAHRVLSGPAGEQIRNGAVLISGDTILAAGPREQVTSQADPSAVHRDYPNGTLLPGLINCHVHLALDAGTDPVLTLRDAADCEVRAGMLVRAQQAAASGVTTLRDLGDRHGMAVDVRNQIAAGHADGPRVLAATASLTIPDGHCWFFGGVVADHADIRAQVQRNAERGADVIKVMASGARSPPGRHRCRRASSRWRISRSWSTKPRG